MYMSFLADMG